jgi:hypothetical protein
MLKTGQGGDKASSSELYIAYWDRAAPLPQSYGFLREPAKRLFGVGWVQTDPDKIVRNANANSTPYHFENIFRGTDAEIEKLLDVGRVKKSNDHEIRHRIYRAVHRDDLFDHLMPVESRTYWAGVDRLGKLICCVVLTLILYLAVLFAPSIMYSAATFSGGVNHTYVGPHSDKVKNAVFARAVEQRFGAAWGEQVPFRDGRNSISDFAKLAKDSRTFAGSVSEEELDAFSKTAVWRLSELSKKREAVAATILLNALKTEERAFKAFAGTFRLIVTPTNNWAEIGTQLCVIIACWVLLTVYFSRKIDFVEILDCCKSKKRLAATVDIMNILSNMFRGRKRVHYLVAATAAVVSTCVHFYFIEDTATQLARPILNLANLEPYDYRLASQLGPVFIAHWLLQFILSFVFVLLAWDDHALGDCGRKIQGHIIRSKLMDVADKSATDRFEKVARAQRVTFYVWVGLSVVAFSLLGFVKIWEAQHAGTVGDWTALSWRDCVKVAYYLGPAIFSSLLIGYGTRPMHESVADAQRMSGPASEEDSAYEAAMKATIEAIGFTVG